MDASNALTGRNLNVDFIKDLRVLRGTIWNRSELLERFPFGTGADPWNQETPGSEFDWIDAFVYRGFQEHGPSFMEAIEGRFAIAFVDTDRGILFVARDWIGEAPMHILATADCLLVSNSIAAILESAGSGYLYSHVRAFPHSCWQTIDLRKVQRGQVDLTMRPEPPDTYYNFRHDVARRAEGKRDIDFARARARLLDATARRVHPGEKAAILLSGGLDSLSIALMLKVAGVEFDAFTLSVGDPEPNGDPAKAMEYAKKLGISHELVTVSPAEIPHVMEEAIHLSESYHLYNVYCAVGMVLLARSLKTAGYRYAFCGEGFNEAVGDYKDWVIQDPRNGRNVTLQHLNSKNLTDSDQRLALVWGPGRDHGRYNHQLGAGLAKHAGSRMFKPFLAYGLVLEAPLLERNFLASIVGLDRDSLVSGGGKPGLVQSLFEQDLDSVGISGQQILNAPKTRLQDAGEGGRGGISPLLFGAGFDQRKVLEVFNRLFAARLPVDQELHRLRGATHGG